MLETAYQLVLEKMKNKFLIIPGENKLEKVSFGDFLFPLKNFCVGISKTFTLEEIPDNSFIYINKLLDSDAIKALENLMPLIEKKVTGVVFEDLGVLEVFRKVSKKITLIYYGTHSLCSSYTVNSFLEEVDSVILSNDITYDEIKEILNKANKNIGLLVYGHLPYMYSRRNLLTNYQENFNLSFNKTKLIKEPISKKEFLVVENEFGTVFYDSFEYDGRVFLKEDNVSYLLIDLNFLHVESINRWLNDFVDGAVLEKPTKGFLEQKTIYRLPPKGE